MIDRPRSSSTALPMVTTVFTVVLGIVIAVIGGRDPLLLYFITTPFPIILLWMARGVGEGPTMAHQAPPALPPGEVLAMPATHAMPTTAEGIA